jgi:Ca2+-binding RTX toxin-like protein
MELALLGNAALFLLGFMLEMGWLDSNSGDDAETDAADTATQNPDTTEQATSENDVNSGFDAKLFDTLANGSDDAEEIAAEPADGSVALFGYGGNDTILGGTLNDWLEGDAGNDIISADQGNDTVFGGTGDDTLYGLEGADRLYGDDGADRIEGNTGDDYLFGGDGDDILSGGGGLDTIFGGAGDDILTSDRADSTADYSRGMGDKLDGGDGDDRIIFTNNDTIYGGAGSDLFQMVVSDGSTDMAIIDDFDPSLDRLELHYTPTQDANGNDIVLQISFQIVSDDDITLVYLDGQAVAGLGGAITDTSAITLVPYSTTLYDGLS